MKTRFFFKFLVLSFLIAYLGGSFANMLFIPHYVPSYTSQVSRQQMPAKSLVKSIDFQRVNFLQVLDRSTFDTDPQSAMRFVAKCVILIFIVLGFLMTLLKTISPLFKIPYICRYTYLSFCCIRI